MTTIRYGYDFLDGLNADKYGLLVAYADYLTFSEQVHLLTEQHAVLRVVGQHKNFVQQLVNAEVENGKA